MREFVSAVEDNEAEHEREAQITALIEKAEAEGKTLSREEAEREVDSESFVEFKVDDRVMRAYQPHEGQLTFMLAALGRGQTKDQRFSAILNIMMASLRDDDQDYLESRLLERNRSKRLKMEQVEAIFEYLTEEWFGNPTQSSSDSAPSQQSDGQN